MSDPQEVCGPPQRGTVRPIERALHAAIGVTFLAIIFGRLLLPALNDPNFGIGADARGGGWSSDFAAHLTFAKAFWAGAAGYDVDSHLRVTSERCGRPVQHALPFGYSPTMLWLLAPLCLLPAAWAYVLWSLLGVAAVWWMSGPRWSVWMAAALFTPVGFACFGIGQTAVLTTAGLLFLMSRDLDRPRLPDHSGGWGTDSLDAVVLWALAAKPPFALTAGVVLLGGRRWRPLVLALALSVISTALLMPWLGMHWVDDYVHLMTHYDLETADPAFTWSLVPETMGNLRALLHVTCGISDHEASMWSSSLWLLALLGLLAASLRDKLLPEARWGFAVLAYLLLCPHVTSTEALQLVLLVALISRAREPVSSPVRWATLGLVLAVLYLPPGIGYQGPLRIPAVFVAKLLLVGLVWAQWVGSWQRRAAPFRAKPAPAHPASPATDRPVPAIGE